MTGTARRGWPGPQARMGGADPDAGIDRRPLDRGRLGVGTRAGQGPSAASPGGLLAHRGTVPGVVRRADRQPPPGPCGALAARSGQGLLHHRLRGPRGQRGGCRRPAPHRPRAAALPLRGLLRRPGTTGARTATPARRAAWRGGRGRRREGRGHPRRRDQPADRRPGHRPTNGPDTPTRTSRNAGSRPGTSAGSTPPGRTGGSSATAAAAASPSSPGRPSSGTGWCQERRRSTTPPWPTSGPSGAAAATRRWPAPPCVCSRRKMAAARCVGPCCCTPTSSHSIPRRRSSGSRPSVRRSANPRSPPTRVTARRTSPPHHALCTPTAADSAPSAPTAVQHFCSTASLRGLLGPYEG